MTLRRTDQRECTANFCVKYVSGTPVVVVLRARSSTGVVQHLRNTVRQKNKYLKLEFSCTLCCLVQCAIQRLCEFNKTQA